VTPIFSQRACGLTFVEPFIPIHSMISIEIRCASIDLNKGTVSESLPGEDEDVVRSGFEGLFKGWNE